MKKITLFMGLILATTMSFSQVIVDLTSVPCNPGLQGTLPFQYAGNLDGTSTDWGLPNIFLGVNSVSGPLEFINDGRAGIVGDGIDNDPDPAINLAGNIGVPPLVGVPKGYLAGDTLGNMTQDLTGKIAVCYRGFYNFSLKALNAQKRGAIGVIIINHTGAAVGMAGGTLGTRVTIPVVQIGRVAGDDLRVAIESCTAGTVTAFIGSKVGVYANDMGSSIADIVMPNELAKPAELAQTGTEFPVAFGFWAFNYGTNAQAGVTASVDVKLGGSTVYSNTSAPLSFAAPAGIVVDTQYFALGNFAPATLAPGKYTVTYTLNLAGADQDPADNTYIYDYTLTGDRYAKSRTDAAGMPLSDSPVQPNETSTPLSDWSACIVFKDATIGSKSRKVATNMTFIGTPVGTISAMDFNVVEARLYKWDNVFTDINDTAGLKFTTMTQVASGTYFYDNVANGDLTGQNVTIPFDVPVNLLSNQRYLACIYTASDSVRIGYDASINYTATINNYLQPISPIRETKTAGAVVTWYRDGFGWDITPSISLGIDYGVGVTAVAVKNNDLAPYPNPAINMLTVPVRKGITGAVTVDIYDLAGKLVISENQTIGDEPLKVNVASISNGAYVFSLTFADGSKDTFKVSVNR